MIHADSNRDDDDDDDDDDQVQPVERECIGEVYK